MRGDEQQKRAGGAPRTPVPAGASGGAMAGAGFQFAGAVLLCLFAGRWLDGRLGTSPWSLVLGSLLGAALGFVALYRTLMSSQGRGQRTAAPPGPPAAPPGAGRTGE